MGNRWFQWTEDSNDTFVWFRVCVRVFFINSCCVNYNSNLQPAAWFPHLPASLSMYLFTFAHVAWQSGLQWRNKVLNTYTHVKFHENQTWFIRWRLSKILSVTNSGPSFIFTKQSTKNFFWKKIIELCLPKYQIIRKSGKVDFMWNIHMVRYCLEPLQYSLKLRACHT